MKNYFLYFTIVLSTLVYSQKTKVATKHKVVNKTTEISKSVEETKPVEQIKPIEESKPAEIETKQPSYYDYLTRYECTANQNVLQFAMDSLVPSTRISLLEATALTTYGLTNDDFRLYEYYNMNEKPLKEGLRINIKEINIGELTLNNVDATIIKNQTIPIVFGKKIIDSIGTITTVNGKYAFSRVILPHNPIKMDMTNEEFGLFKRKDLVAYSLEELRRKPRKNLTRFVNGYEKEKEFRITNTYKAELYAKQDDESYRNELTKATISESFKKINTSLETKSILSYYNNIVFLTSINYLDSTYKIKYSISKENLKKLPIPFTEEQLLELLTIIK
jgi:hypothetical protein